MTEPSNLTLPRIYRRDSGWFWITAEYTTGPFRIEALAAKDLWFFLNLPHFWRRTT